MSRSLANPIKAGLDAFSQIRGEQRADIQLEEQVADRKLNRDLVTQRMSKDAEQAEWERRNQKHKEWEQETERQQKELGPVLNEAKLIQLQGGTLKPQHINAVRKIHKESPVFDDDPAVASQQVASFKALDGIMATMDPNAIAAANGKITRDNAPDAIGHFNTAYAKIINSGLDDRGQKPLSKTVEEVAFKGGNLIPIVKTVRQDGTSYMQFMTEGRDGTPDAKAIEIPAGIFSSYNKEHAEFGDLIEASTGYVGGDNEAVKEAVKTRSVKSLAGVEAKALKEFQAEETEGMSVSERRVLLREKLRSNGYTGDAHKIATELVAEKEPTDKPTGHIVVDKTSPTGWSYLTEKGNKTKGAPPPKKDLGEEIIEERRLARSEKKTEETKAKRDARIKERAAIIQKTTDGKLMTADEVQDEAVRLIDSEDSGKPAITVSEKKERRLQPLRDSFDTSENPESLIESAVEKGWSKEDIKAASASAPQKVRDAVDKRFAEKKIERPKAKAEKPPEKKKKEAFDNMPLPSQHSGKILSDKTSGKRYKSDGKRWNEIN